MDFLCKFGTTDTGQHYRNKLVEVFIENIKGTCLGQKTEIKHILLCRKDKAYFRNIHLIHFLDLRVGKVHRFKLTIVMLLSSFSLDLLSSQTNMIGAIVKTEKLQQVAQV